MRDELVNTRPTDSRAVKIAAWESSELSDEVLAASVVENRDAFRTLYLRYVHQVFSYFTWKFGSGTAEDLTSDVFVRALRMADKFQSGKSWRAWLFGIARNRSMEYWRERSRHQRQPDRREEPNQNPEHIVIQTERAESVRELLAAIPDKSREIVELRFWAGLSYREVAEIVGKSEGALRVDVHRVLRSLKDVLEERSDD
ncbi:MAG: RNA polymerase sigma factor [Dehalococcoidia bacterium]